MVDAVIAGTHVIPSLGRSVLTKAMLEQMAVQLRSEQVVVLRDHDIDQQMQGVSVVNAEVRPTPDGEYQLHVTYDAPDDVAAEMIRIGGMSIGFSGYFDDPNGPTDPDVGLTVDPPERLCRQDVGVVLVVL